MAEPAGVVLCIGKRVPIKKHGEPDSAARMSSDAEGRRPTMGGIYDETTGIVTISGPAADGRSGDGVADRHRSAT